MTDESPNTRSRIPWIIAVLILALTLPIAFMIMYRLSTKEGVEFSPDDFRMRRFSYVKVDWLNWTISGLRHADVTTSFHESLIDDAWIKPVTNTNKTWPLVSDTITPENSPDFDAKILDEYMRMSFWSDWNSESKNSKKAKALWPAVAALARNYVYWGIPDLMDLAIDQKKLSDQKFAVTVNSLTAQALLENGKVLLADGESQAAERSLSAGLTFRRTRELLLARAESYDQLNKPELAKADRKSAGEMATE